MAASILQPAKKPQLHDVVEPRAFTPADFWACVGIFSEHSELSPEHRSSTSANNREFHFRINKYDFFESTEILGHGSLGVVETLKIRGKDIRVACKTARRYNIMNLRKEVKMLKRVDNKHIVRFIGSFEPLRSTDTYSLVMSPVGEGDLEKYLTELNQEAPNSFRSNALRGWFLCLASALDYLHANGIRHEDIKPSNIIYLGTTILFTDFGSSTTFNPDITTSTESQAYGTARYQAPEIRDNIEAHGARSDIFSLGCVFLEMLTVVMGLPLSQLHSFCRLNAGSMNRTLGSFLYCNVIDQLDKWFFGETPGMELAVIWKEIVQPMLHPDRKKRPKALHVVHLLQTGFIPAILPSYCTDCNNISDSGARCKSGLIEFFAPPSVTDDQWPSDAIDDASTRITVLTNIYRMFVSQVPSRLWQKSFSTSLNMNMKGFRGHLEVCLTELLQYSSFRGNEGLVKTLLRYRGDVNAPGQHWGSALQAARSGGSEKIVQILQENGATDEPQGNLGTFLAVLSYHGNGTLARILLEDNYTPEIAQEELSNALEIASSLGHEPMVKALLRAGADPNASSSTHGTALIAASYNGRVNVVRRLLKAGADVNMQTDPHNDALCAASQAGHAKIVKILLGRVAKDDFRRERCERAMQAAAEAGYDSVLQRVRDWLSQSSTKDDITDDDTCDGDSSDGESTSSPPTNEPDGSFEAKEDDEEVISKQFLSDIFDKDQTEDVDQEFDPGTPVQELIPGSPELLPKRIKKTTSNLHSFPMTGEAGRTMLGRSLGRVRTFFY